MFVISEAPDTGAQTKGFAGPLAYGGFAAPYAFGGLAHPGFYGHGFHGAYWGWSAQATSLLLFENKSGWRMIKIPYLLVSAYAVTN